MQNGGGGGASGIVRRGRWLCLLNFKFLVCRSVLFYISTEYILELLSTVIFICDREGVNCLRRLKVKIVHNL